MPDMQSEAEVAAAFAKYTNSVGLLTEWKEPGSLEADNGFCHTGCQVLCYTLRGTSQTDLRVRFRQALFNSMVKDKEGKLIPGLFNRSPGIKSLIAWDDLIAIAYVERAYASALYQLGQAGVKWGPIRFKFVYNNVEPTKFTWEAWQGRSPSFVANLHWAVGRTPPWWARLGWVISVAFGGKPTDQDPWKLSRFLIETFSRHAVYAKKVWLKKFPLEDWAIKRWENRFMKAWPGGFGALYTRYFVAGSDHPLARYWPKEF